MRLLDTQIISYAFKGSYNGEISRQCIASVTANEFLLVHSDTRTKANYYVPLPSRLKIPPDGLWNLPRRDHPFSRRITDQIVLEFGQDYPAIVTYGNLAIAEIINTQARRLFSEALRFLDKEQKKTIWDTFEFLLDHEVRCVPLSRRAVELGMQLFYEFILRYNTKQNVRNTVNDVMILATAIHELAVLITEDSLLGRFASEHHDGTLEEGENSLSIDFRSVPENHRQVNKESKGYINKGWQARIRNYRGAW